MAIGDVPQLLELPCEYIYQESGHRAEDRGDCTRLRVSYWAHPGYDKDDDLDSKRKRGVDQSPHSVAESLIRTPGPVINLTMLDDWYYEKWCSCERVGSRR